jgi:DNA-binding NarL/FixJ family response regulator
VKKKIKILVACGQKTSCSAISGVKKEKDFVVLKEVYNLNDTIRRIQKTDLDILFLCSHFLIENWKDIVAKIMEKIKRTKIVIFNCHFTRDQELMLAKEGVVGILDCSMPPSSLTKALRKVHEGELWLRRELLPLLVNAHLNAHDVKVTRKSDSPITKRELEILFLIANGHKNREISSELCISETTVKTHIQNIFKKLNIDNRFQAMLYTKKYILPGSD